MKFANERNELMELGASLFARGFTSGSSGNISVKVDGGYLMTPTNSSLGRLVPDRISYLDNEWNHVSGDAPSKEVIMHKAMYEARPDTGAIVHLHSVYVTALSCLAPEDGPLITPHTPYLVMKMGRDLPLVPYYKPGDPKMEEDIYNAAKKSVAVILANHGSLVAAPTLVKAVDAAEELEVSAQLALLLHGRKTRPLSADEIDALLN